MSTELEAPEFNISQRLQELVYLAQDIAALPYTIADRDELWEKYNTLVPQMVNIQHHIIEEFHKK